MKWTDLAFKILSILVVPLMLWGIRLEVSNAVQNEKISKLEAAVAAAGSLRDGMAVQSVAIGRVEEKVDATNKRLDEIRTDLRRSLPPGP
jgi:uncharacterized coiled-coil protein SlyX